MCHWKESCYSFCTLKLFVCVCLPLNHGSKHNVCWICECQNSPSLVIKRTINPDVMTADMTSDYGYWFQ